MHITERHGRKGQPTEYYEFTVRMPRFVAQGTGDLWVVTRCDPGGVWHTQSGYLPEHEARLKAYQLLQEYLNIHCAAWTDLARAEAADAAQQAQDQNGPDADLDGPVTETPHDLF